ncbi:MAG TPA: chromate transporter [Gemmatimonadales bacterium]|nr:chromate transporter [Gemmatimonadales bacterium]
MLPAPPGPLGDVARLFLLLGSIGFGGPAAHIALMEREVVTKRGWLDRQRFLTLVGASQLIPGPNSTELAIHIGYARAGWPGLVVAGACFILPAVALVSLAAAAYQAYGSVPAVTAVFAGVAPVVLAIVTEAGRRLGGTALDGPLPIACFLAAAVAGWVGVPELAVILGAAAIGALLHWGRPHVATAGAIVLADPTAIFGLFARIGAVLVGSGYVLLAFLRTALVEQRGWLTERQLLDAIAIGQATPGPVFTTATFVGWLLAGPIGAAAATVGIFLPAFIFVAITAPFLDRVASSALGRQVLRAVTAASLALLLVVTIRLAGAAWGAWWGMPLTALSFALLRSGRTSPTVVIGLGALVGLLAT